MLPYWLLFLLFSIPALTNLRQSSPSISGKNWSISWRVTFIFLTFIIGLRHEVGGDWIHYFRNLEAISYLSLSESLLRIQGDPADSFLNWIAAQLGLGIYLVNFIYASLFSWGLLIFCRNQTRPWLALTVAVPYLTIVVAMGYSRQGVAIGLAMLGLVALENKGVLKYLIWISLAALFHKSAIILIPLAVFDGTRSRLLKLLGVGFILSLLFFLLLQDSLDRLIGGYIYDQYDSSGAAIRIAMNAIPAVIFLLWRRRFALSSKMLTFWSLMAWGALAFVALLYISPSSTAVDRLALYWIPLQLFVWSRFPDVIGRSGAKNSLWVYLVVGYSAATQFVWLYFATYSYLWLPYQFYPWVWLWA